MVSAGLPPLTHIGNMLTAMRSNSPPSLGSAQSRFTVWRHVFSRLRRPPPSGPLRLLSLSNAWSPCRSTYPRRGLWRRCWPVAWLALGALVAAQELRAEIAFTHLFSPHPDRTSLIVDARRAAAMFPFDRHLREAAERMRK